MKVDKNKLLKKVWENCTFDEIIDAGFDLNKCSSLNLIEAADEFKTTSKIYDSFLGDLEELFEQYKNNLPWTKDILDIVTEYCGVFNVIDSLDEDDIIDQLDGSYSFDNYVKKKVIEEINECEDDNGLFCNNKITDIRREIIRYIQNLDREGFRRVLCDLVDLHYCIDNDRLLLNLKNRI